MQKTPLQLETLSPIIKPALILSLAVIAAYSPVLFLNQTYNESTPLPLEYLGYHGKSTLFSTTSDKWGDFQAIWPELELGSKSILQGQVPLWDPYIGVGQPLSADANVYVFSPLMLGFLLPIQFWDVPLLIALWVAGMFTFLFLRNLELGFAGSITGGIFYMLSGGFSWFLTNPNLAVMAFTPFILYSLEKIITRKDPKYIALASVAFCSAILGGHLESIILQLVLIVSYLCYRLISLQLRHRHLIYNSNDENIQKPAYNQKRILCWLIVAFVGGLGLSSFFILPVYEFIGHNQLEHGQSVGAGYYPPINLAYSFVPYILGQLHVYWFSVVAGMVGQWGYVGVLALFFSIIGIFSAAKNKNSVHKYTPLFFLALSVFFIMKTVGVPIVNWIGYLPILNMVLFTNYSGIIIPFGFALAAAFGIDFLNKSDMKTKNLLLVFLISVSIILLLLIPLVPYLSSDAKFPPYVSANDARDYVGFQIIQSVLFALMASLVSIATVRNRSAIIGIVSIVLLELSLYIPVGLHPIWAAYKSILVICAMAAITFLVLKPNKLTWNTSKTKNIKLYPMIIVLLITFVSEAGISYFSPYGMMERYDSYQANPLVNFLKENLGTSRMFSFDYSLGPNYPAGYEISTIGQFSAYNINSFYAFLHNFLDKDADEGRLGSPPWTYSYGPMDSIDKFQENKKYFDFLGTKYILIQGYGFDTIAPGIPGLSGQYAKIESSENSTGQSFISPIDSLAKIGVSFGSSTAIENNKIILTLDSVPYDKKYHRESILNQTIINQQYTEFFITPPLTSIQGKHLYMSLRFPQADINNLAAVFTMGENQTGYDTIKNKLNGKFYQNGMLIDGKEMVFSITPAVENHPPVFKFYNINVYENKDAFPRSFLVTKFHVVDTGKAQDFLIKNPDFDLRHDVVVEEQLPKQWNDQLNSSMVDENSTEIISYSENKVVIDTNNKGASLLVLTDAYYPGWKAYVDGQESKIYKSDGLVRSVFIPAGSHLVKFVYEPQSFMLGVIISIITGAILVGILIYSKKRDPLIILHNTFAQIRQYK